MIRFDNVSKTYKGGSCVALRDINIDIDKGEFVFLVGASGSGKTTFIRLLLREELPDTGQILEAGRNIVELPKWRVPYLRRNIGCVFTAAISWALALGSIQTVTWVPRSSAPDAFAEPCRSRSAAPTSDNDTATVRMAAMVISRLRHRFDAVSRTT